MSDSSRRSSRRRSRRDRQHRDSHAQSGPLEPVPEYAGVPRDQGILVTDSSGLDEVIAHLESHDVIAFDTEFIGEETYYPNVCLVQVGTRDAVFLVDPLAIDHLVPLWEVIASPDRTTLVHAGRQDLQILARDLGRVPQRTVDTQVLAALAGLPWPCALTKTIKSALDITVPPGMTFTAWDARPLSAKQLRYAADDVRYLPAVHEVLMSKITQRDHAAWAEAACAVFDDPDWYEADIDNQQRKLEGSRRFRRAERCVLRRLIEARDAIARAEDAPPRATMPDTVLLAIVRDSPGDAEALGGLRGMPRPIANRHGETIFEAIRLGLEDTEAPTRSGHGGNESPENRMAIDGLWSLFSAACVARGIAPALVLSRTELAGWVLGGCTGVPGKQPWQRVIASAVLDPLRSGSGTLALQWHEGRVTQVQAAGPGESP